MTDSNDCMFIDTSVINIRAISTKNTGELRVNFNNDSPSKKTDDDDCDNVSKKPAEICRAYQKDGSCLRKNCNFQHVDSNEKIADNQFDADKQCRYFMSQNGCKFNDDCMYKHYRGEADAGSCQGNENENNIEDVVIDEADLDDELQQQRKSISSEVDRNTSEIKKNNKSLPCKFFQSLNGCNKKRCRFDHDSDARSNMNYSQDLDSLQEILCGDSSMDEEGKALQSRNSSSNTKDNKTYIEDRDKKHLETSSSVTDIESGTKKDDKKISVCKFFNKKGRGCLKGEKCPHLHEEDSKRKETKTNQETSDHEHEPKLNQLDPKLNDNKVPIKRKKNCRYFNTKQGCFYDDCPFNHDAKIEPAKHLTETKGDGETINSSNDIEQESMEPEKTKSKRVCRFFKSERGCNRGSRCNNAHSQSEIKTVADSMGTLSLNDATDDDTTVKKENTLKPNAAINNGKSIQQPQQQRRATKSPEELRVIELSQLEKRWKDHFECLQNEPASVYTVSMTPTDPDWVGYLLFVNLILLNNA